MSLVYLWHLDKKERRTQHTLNRTYRAVVKTCGPCDTFSTHIHLAPVENAMHKQSRRHVIKSAHTTSRQLHSVVWKRVNPACANTWQYMKPLIGCLYIWYICVLGALCWSGNPFSSNVHDWLIAGRHDDDWWFNSSIKYIRTIKQMMFKKILKIYLFLGPAIIFTKKSPFIYRTAKLKTRAYFSFLLLAAIVSSHEPDRITPGQPRAQKPTSTSRQYTWWRRLFT